jgi:hypothetical protein
MGAVGAEGPREYIFSLVVLQTTKEKTLHEISKNIEHPFHVAKNVV